VAKSWNPVSRGWHLSPHGYGPAHASNNCWSKPKARSKLRDKALKMQSFKMSSYLLSLALWLAANSLAGTTIPQSKGDVTQFYSDVNLTMQIGLMGLGTEKIYEQRRRRRNYNGGRITYYGNNHTATFKLEYIDKDFILRACDIEKNPGPICQKSIVKNNWALPCEKCEQRAHIKCGSVSPQQYNSMLGMRDMKWCCPGCLRHNTDPVRNVVTTTHTREITNPLKEMKENKII